ncbi:dTDP-RhA:a-D-GlcNAc-diphosphoryl polyprenol, a-3-L-rhamnosyl transferase [Mycobacteroides abscessus subsp. abscessus]|nr:dTDP-RhA:a-D-GlcNAc-diphosphoryl polyprenol, a-3-L-rhamnosyl transferase [Mycobacteroides abscessus subsp. abscessus]
MSGAKVSIIIPNYNGAKDTIECLDSMESLIQKEVVNVIIVDNGSKSEDVTLIENWIFENVKCEGKYIYELQELNLEHQPNNYSNICIINNINNGYAGAINIGIKYSNQLYKNVQYYWVLNNDTVIKENTLLNLLDFVSGKTSVGMVGSTILEYHNPNVIQYAGGARYYKLFSLSKSNLKGVKIDSLKSQNFKGPRLDYVSGASMFIPKTVIEKVGFFNESYFLYYEELDYTKRLEKEGYNVLWCKESVLYHKGGNSIGSRSVKRDGKSELAEYYSNLSCLKFSNKFYSRILFSLIFTNRFILKSFSFLLKREIYLFRPLVRSYIDYLTSKKVI